MARDNPDGRTDTNPSENPDLKGPLETAQGLPPGIDIETAEEAPTMPRDRKASELADFGEAPESAREDASTFFGDSPDEATMHDEGPL
ncbi:MAG TPA: hypothetical protein VFV02_04120 [Acidimicrobiales bacterium]|nr:hypothetical protein [Acidimicrobiales bacterium]